MGRTRWWILGGVAWTGLACGAGSGAGNGAPPPCVEDASWCDEGYLVVCKDGAAQKQMQCGCIETTQPDGTVRGICPG